MTIDQAYRFCNFVSNKEQRGQLVPADFNNLAPQAQLEAILTRLGSPKTLNGRYLPQIGYKVTQQAKEEILPLIKKTTATLVATSGIAPYPADFLSFDHCELNDGTLLTEYESDQMARAKKSQIFAPDATHPACCCHGEGIELSPTNAIVYLYYVRRPLTPNWDYTASDGVFVYNSTGTPQLSGAISQNFETPERLHKEICMIILKYLGINLSDAMLSQFAAQVQATNP